MVDIVGQVEADDTRLQGGVEVGFAVLSELDFTRSDVRRAEGEKFTGS